MTNPLDKLNLRPFEKRLVVGVAVVVFIVVNALFVFPRFSDWCKVQQRMTEARDKLEKWRSIAAQESSIQRQVNELENRGGVVDMEDQVFQFTKTIEDQ